LKFNDSISDWLHVRNGIGQEEPLSMIVYLIYNADLIDIANPRNKDCASPRRRHSVHSSRADLRRHPRNAQR
ncbi:hypothetical protein BDR03DRAFT_872116, partial [Suillus americanus]